jgi:hypothetical protein
MDIASPLTFPCELTLVRYCEHNEHENENWMLEFLIPLELKPTLLKMKEILEHTRHSETYEIDYNTIMFSTQADYDGFVCAKENTVGLGNYKSGYKFIGYISDRLPHERKLLEEINKKYNRNFSNIIEACNSRLHAGIVMPDLIPRNGNSISDDDDDDDDDDCFDCLNLHDVFYKEFTEPKF